MKKFVPLIVLILIFVFILFFWDNILGFYLRLSLRLPQIEKEITGLIQETEKQISTPPPLRAKKETPKAFLTRDGVIRWTNIQREKYGLPPLKENLKLDTSAEKKVEDMFENQYFSHIAPSGIGVENLVKSVGYQFIAIGENLALGNFQSDEMLVEGWMESPGHRQNILNARYEEIGVAVKKGIFEGKPTWLAVQHFGLPLSACPQPDETLKTKIEENQNQIKELKNNLDLIKIEIETLKPKHSPVYFEKILQYNNLVDQYNALINETEDLINQYNNQVKIFNDCAAGIE